MNRSCRAFAVPLFLSLMACGDPREAFSGSYSYSGEITYGFGEDARSFPLDGRFEVIADRFDSERLFLGMDCGLDWKVENDFMKLVPKVCPVQPDEDCSHIARYERGSGTVEGGTLTLTFGGNIDSRCSGTLYKTPFTFELVGARGDDPNNPDRPGDMSRDGEPGPSPHWRLILPDVR